MANPLTEAELSELVAQEFARPSTDPAARHERIADAFAGGKRARNRDKR